MDVERFREVIAPLTEAIAGKAIDARLAVELERRFPPCGEAFRAIEAPCCWRSFFDSAHWSLCPCTGISGTTCCSAA